MRHEPYQRWRPSEDEILRRMWLGNYAQARIIGEVLGRTKNSVISRVHRLGLRRA